MNSETIFTVKNEHLDRLDQKTSVEFFQKLLWAEARRLGVEISNINVSNWINVPDGGVDANVDDAEIKAGQGLIKPGKSSYQIKAGATFKPWQKSVIKKELFGTKDPGRQNLGESIQVCLDTEGTYILVCTGIDPVEPQREKIRSHIEEYLKQCDYPHPKVDMFTQSTLRGFLDSLPSLALSLNGNDKTTFQSHQSWSKDDTMKHKFVPGPAQKNLVAKIRRKLRTNKEAIHIRILGESGSGKSKLAHNATRVKDLSPLVIYCEASQFKDSDLLNHIFRDDNHFDVILVVDECNSNDRSYIWDKLKNRGSRIKLITISNDYEEETADLTHEKMPLLKEEYIRKILMQEYQIHDASVYQWAEFCSGLPGVAHMIGANLKNDQENLLAPLSTVNFWERCIVGGDDSIKPDVDDRWPVLRYLALFKQFGFKGNVSHEFSAISEIVENAFPLITRQRFRKIVLDLKKRGILKGDYTFHITPKVLHVKLWLEWWGNYYDEDFDLTEFTQNFRPELHNLHNWFCDMFRYAAESDEAIKIVKQLLGPNGPFMSDSSLENINRNFFLVLTEADPISALECLKQTIGKCESETLLQFTARRNVVWALEKIAIWRKLFPDAARLLLALGEAENEGIANNASGVFAELFSLGPGAVAPTEAPPIERLPVLKEAFESGSKERRKLALNACHKGLQSGHFSRSSGSGNQGLRGIPKLWEPKTYGEWWDAYRQIWQLLSEQLEHLSEGEREEAVGILLGRAGSLGRIPALGDMIVDTVERITEKKYASEKQIIEIISRILFHDDSYIDNKGLPTGVRQRFEKIRDGLIDSDYHSQMQRYVGMDLVEDQIEKGKNGVDRVQPYLEKLAQQSVKDSDLLHSELSWLVTTDAKNGDKFGYELGKKDKNFTLLPTLLDAQRNESDNASPYLLGGYFRVLFENNITEWEDQLDELVEDNTLNLLIPEITSRSGLTDRAGLRILELAKRGILSIKHLNIFVYGRTIKNLSDEVFKAWVEFLLSIPNKSAISTTLNLYHCYFLPEKEIQTLPCDLTFQILTHPILFEESKEYQFGIMTDYYWTEIAKIFLELYPQRGRELADLMLSHFGAEGTIVGGFDPKTALILCEIAKQHSEQVWQLVGQHLEMQNDFSKTLTLESWLREGDISETETEKGVITIFPPKTIWKWVDGNVETRAGLIARLVPITLIEDEWQTSLARTLLKRYGSQDEVLHSLNPTGVGAGPASSRCNTIKQRLLQIKGTEDDRNVIRWIEDYIEALDHYIENARIEEERRF